MTRQMALRRSAFDRIQSFSDTGSTDHPGIPMDFSTGLTSGRYLHHWLEKMAQSGASNAELFAGTGLQPTQLEQHAPWLTQQQVERLFANAYALTGNAWLGLEFGMNLNFAAHGPLGFAGLTARTIEESQQQMVRFSPLVTGLVKLETHKDNRQQLSLVTVTAQPGVAQVAARSLIQTVLCSIYVMTRFLLGNDADIHLFWRCDEDDHMRLAFAHNSHTHLHFNADQDALAIALPLLETPVILADEQARQQALSMCEADMRALEKQTLLSHRIYARLLESGDNMPGIEELAGEYHLSTRTVHRRLQDEGTCFRDLTSAARMTLARDYLLRERLTVTEVAHRLGYGDSANFTRAFKRAEGVTPTEYVRLHDAENAG